jgi:hypothetical protein
MQEKRLYRLYELIPGVLTWSLLLIPFVFYKISPIFVSIFFLIYVELWFFRSMKYAIQIIYAWRKSVRFKQIDFNKLLSHFSDNPPREKLPIFDLVHRDFYERLAKLKATDDFIQFKDIIHVVILATYKEDIEILRSSIGEIFNSDYPKEKIYFVLATEERDKERAEKYSKILQEEYGHKFGRFYSFMHPKDIPGEIIGKGGNITFAGRKIAEVLEKDGIDSKNVIVTSLDADNRVSKDYFLCLAYNYLIAEDRKKKSYQPLPLFYNNIWNVPIFSRLIAISNTFFQMVQFVSLRNLRNFSSHAQSLEALKEMDFWATNTIVEDGHQFWRAYFKYNGDHYVVPLFVPIYQDAVQGKTYFDTIAAQYKQLRRWAWGCTDIPFILINMKKKDGKIPFWRNFDVAYNLIEGHVMWATTPVMVTVSSTISKLLRDSSNTVFVYNLSHILSILFTVALTGVFVSMCVSLAMLPKTPKGIIYKFSYILQWVFLPLITVFFGALPAIDAHTRLMIGKRLDFNVTEKFRR